MSRQWHDEPAEQPVTQRDMVLEMLVDSLLEGNFARLLETYYISREPGYFYALHWLASLSEQARQRLGDFIGIAENYDVYVERSNRLTLVLNLVPRPKKDDYRLDA
jgi:hypothetical protein